MSSIKLPYDLYTHVIAQVLTHSLYIQTWLKKKDLTLALSSSLNALKMMIYHS